MATFSDEELFVDNNFVDFGDLDYSPGISHFSGTTRFKNVGDGGITMDPTIQYTNNLEEFPVQLQLNVPNSTNKDIPLCPNEALEVSFVLKPDINYMSLHNLGTSYFKVSRRFHINYRTEEGTTKSLSMSFGANLCISTMFLENPTVNIENKIAGEEFSHDIMIWNRSESNLVFRFADVAVTKIGDSDEPIIFLSSNGILIDPWGDTALSVPSFAPKIITMRISSKIPGKFAFKCKLVNTRNMSNCEVLDIQGCIVEQKDIKQWQLIDEESAHIIDIQNGIRKLYLGDFFFGQRIVRKLSVMNMGSSEMNMELSRNSSVNKEIRLTYLDDKDGEILLEDFQSSAVSVTPKVRDVNSLPVNNLRNPYSSVWNDVSSAETRSWDSFESSFSSPSTGLVSISKLCVQLFSQEYIENGDEEDLNFGLLRPLHTQRNHTVVHSQSGTKRMFAKALKIPSGGKVTIIAEVCPTQEHHENLSHEHAQLMKRVTEVRMLSSSGEESNAIPESIVKETISFEYRACMCKIAVSPPSQTLGECHIGESYKVPISVTNLSELPVSLKPVIASSGCEISMGEIKLAALEKKNVTIRLVPTIETAHFSATVRFRSVVGMVDGEIEVTGKSTNAMPLKFHNLFYQLNGSLVRNKHQLHFGRVLCNMNNYAKVRVKNTSRIPLKLSLWNHESVQLRMASVAVESDLPPVFEKVGSFDQEAADVMRSDIEELKWGLSFLENSSLPTPKFSNSKGEGKSLILSTNVEALDVTPLPSKRSSEYSRRHGSLGHERALMERYSELHHFTSFQDLGAEMTKEKEKDSLPPRVTNRADSSTREMIDTMKKLVFPWLFRELDTDKLITDIEDAEVASFAQFSNQDCVRPFLTNSDGDEQEKARAAQDLQQRLESWFSKNYLPVYQGEDPRDIGIPLGYSRCLEVKVNPGEERDLIFELYPTFHEESDIDGKLFNSSIIAKIESIEAEAIRQMLSEAVQEDTELERLVNSDANAIQRLSLYSIPIHYQAFCAEFAIVPRSINFGRTIVGDTVIRYVRLVNKSPLYCPYVIEKSGSIASGFLSIIGGRKGIIPPLSSVNLEIRFKPSMPFILEEDLKIRNVINAQNDQVVPMKSKVLRTETFAIALQDEAEFPKDEDSSLLSLQNMMNQEFREPFNSLLSFISGENKLAASTVKDGTNPSSLFKYMGSSAVGKNPTIVVKFILRNMTSRTRQFIVDSTSNDAVELLDLSQLSLHDVNDEKSAEVIAALRSLVGHSHNFPPIPEVLQNVLCMRCHFSSRLEKQQRINIQAVEDDESLQLLLDQLEKMQQKLKIALRKNKAEKIVKYRKKVEDCIQQLASKASSKPSADAVNRTKKKGSDKPSSTMITEDTELAHFVELAPEEEVHIEMRLSYLPSAQYRLWKGLLPFIGRVRVFEVRHEDIKKTLYFGTMLYASTIEMSSISDTGRSRMNSFESDVNSEVSSVGFDRKLNLANIKEVDAKSAPFLVTIPLWCSMMTKQVYPKYKKIPLNTLGGSVKLSKSRKDNSMSGTFMITSFHSKYGQLEFTIDEKFIPVQIVTESKSVVMNDYGSMMIKIQDSPPRSGFGLDIKDGSPKDSTVSYHNLSDKRFVTSLSQRARKSFSLRWNPSQFVELPSEEFKLIGALKVTYGASDNTYYSLLLPFVCAYQHKSIIEVDKYCSLGDRSIGSYSTLQFIIKNTSLTEELHYIVTAESSDVQTAKGFVEIISGKSAVIPPGESRNVSILFTATSLGRFSQKLWVQNIRDGFDQRRIVAQANVIVSPARFVVFPDLDPADVDAKKKEIDFGLVEIQENEMVYCDCQYDSMLADPSNGVYVLHIRNVSTTRLSVTAVSNLRKQCFIFADKDGSIPAVNVLLPKGEDSYLYVFLRPTNVVDSTANTGTQTKTNMDTTALPEFQREITGGIRLVFFSAEADPSSSLSTTQQNESSAGDTPIVTQTSIADEMLVFRKLFETALSFRATVGKSLVKAGFVADDIFTVRERNENSYNVESSTIPLKIRNESQCFPLRYWLCTCSRSSYSGNSVFHLVNDEDRTGFLKPKQDIVASVAIERGDELVGLSYKHLRVHNLGANESSEVANMLHFPSSDLTVKLDMFQESLTSYVRVKHLFQASSSSHTAEESKDRDALISTLPYCRTLECEVSLENVSSMYMALYPVSNLPICLTLKDPVQHLTELADLATIDLGASQARVEELVLGFSRNLRRQAISIPPYRLGKFQLCGPAFVIKPKQRVVFSVSSLQDYGGDWFVANDLRRLTHNQLLDFMGFLGFMCLNITTKTIEGAEDVYEVVPPETRRFSDHSYLALRGGFRLPMKIFSPRISVKPREIKLGNVTDVNPNMTVELELANKTVADIVCVIEASSSWMTGITAVLSLADGTLLEGETWRSFDTGRIYTNEFAPNVTVKIQLSVSVKQLLSDSFLNIHSFTKEASMSLNNVNSIDWPAIEQFRVASQMVKVHFESQSLPPSKGFVISVADSKSTLLAQGNIDRDALAATAAAGGLTALPINPFLTSDSRLSVLFGEPISLPRTPTPDAIAFKEKRGLVSRKTCKFTIKNLSRRHVAVQARFSPLARFMAMVDTEASFSNSDQSMTKMNADESCQLKIRVGFIDNFKLTKRILDGMKAIVMPSDVDIVSDLSWTDLSALFPTNKADDVYLISPDKRRIVLKIGQGTIHMAPKDTNGEDTNGDSLPASHRPSNDYSTNSTQATPSVTPMTHPNVSYSESMDLFVTVSLEPAVIPAFSESLLSMVSPMKSTKSEGDEDNEAIHFLFCGSLECDEMSSLDVPASLDSMSNNASLMTAHTFRPQYCSLLEDSQTFYLHNLTTTLYKFKMKSESIRFPGLRLIFPQSSFVGGRPPMEIWTDTIRLAFEPESGEIAPASMLQVRAFFIPASPSDAKCVTAPAITDAAQSGPTSSSATASATTATTNSSSITNMTDLNQLSTNLLYKAFTINCDILDREDSLHPPVHIAATLIIDRAISLLKSQPISETSRKKQHLDLVLTDDSAVAPTTISAPAVSISSTNNHTLSNTTSSLFNREDGNSSNIYNNNSHSSNTNIHLSSMDTSLSNTASPLPMNINLGATPYPSSTSLSSLSNANHNKVRLRKRGITPHPTSPYHGFIDLGKQVERADALEWEVTLENRSAEYTQYYELHALSAPPTEDWIVFSQNGGILDKNGSSTFMLYFVRSQVGRYVSYLLIRDMHQRDRDHIICITMEVIADQRRQSTLALAFPSVASDIDLFRGSFADLWWQRYVEVMTIAQLPVSTASTNTTNVPGLVTSYSGYFHQHLSPSPSLQLYEGNEVPVALSSTSSPPRFRDMLITSPITHVRIKNLTNIILQFYFTQPGFVTVTALDLVSYQRSVDANGNELFRVLPNETITVKVVISDEWMIQQQQSHIFSHSQSFDQVVGLSLPTSTSIIHLEQSQSQSNVNLMQGDLSSPYRSGSASPVYHGGQPHSQQPLQGQMTSPGMSNLPTSGPSPSFHPSASQSMLQLPSLAQPQSSSSSLLSTFAPRREVVLCHCALFDNLVVQLPIALHSQYFVAAAAVAAAAASSSSSAAAGNSVY